MATYINDPFSGADNAAWSSQWTSAAASNAASAYLSSSRGLENAGTDTTYNAYCAMRYSGGTVTDVDITGSILLPNLANDDGSYQINVRAPANLDNTQDGYTLHVIPMLDPSAYVRKAVGRTVTELGNFLPHSQATIAQGDIWGFRFRVVGSSIQARLWQGGTEPTTWNVDVTDTAITGPGYFGLVTKGGNTGGMQASFDTILAVDGGVVAPPPGLRTNIVAGDLGHIVASDTVHTAINSIYLGSIGSTRTSAFTLAQTDSGTTIPVNSAGTVAVTVPQLAVGSSVELFRMGTGVVTLTTTGGVVLSVPVGAPATPRVQYTTISLLWLTASSVLVGGDLG